MAGCRRSVCAADVVDATAAGVVTLALVAVTMAAFALVVTGHFLGQSAHLLQRGIVRHEHTAAEMEVLAGQGMVQVHHHLVFLHFLHHGVELGAVFVGQRYHVARKNVGLVELAVHNEKTLVERYHVLIDIVTVSEKLRSRGDLEEIGGPVELARLSQNIGAAAHIEYYIKILKQKTIQRDLITASYDILKQSFDESTNVDDLIDNAQTKVFAAIQNNVKRDVQDIGSIINSVLDNLQELQNITGPSGVPSGYPSIDRVTQGWQKSDLIILAARPSVGKTAFALNIARNAAVDANMPVAVFSLEMSADQLGKRLITTESGLSGEKIKGGVKLETFEWIQLEDTLKRLAKAHSGGLSPTYAGPCGTKGSP